jgi:ABC-type sugar transport system substrate-binding protein
MFCALGMASLCAQGAAAAKLVVDVDGLTGAFSVKVDDDVWFRSADIFVPSSVRRARRMRGVSS